ncbi:uncharacterized protein LOC130760553 isoform X2 [Actinidia eriantha]|uniref:uncharacterized protein LOC130760553 isoform X2 n=1 Tax=Actinidia eriantha TaxID=165200 RepID=UPI00258C1B35|nr:uncharacterized protein LOC130760553 isoform X2 [Actinidia eriantha]
MKMTNSEQPSKLDNEELVKHDKQGLDPVCESFRRKRLNAHTYKELLRSLAIKAKTTDALLPRNKRSGEGGFIIESNGSNEVDKNAADSSSSCLKNQRLNAKVGNDLSCVSLSKDGMDLEAGLSFKCSKERIDDIRSTESSSLNVETDGEHITCAICMLGGELLSCDGLECKRSFHLSCVDPPLSYAPPGSWHCILCVQKKIQFGVHSVSEGVESILDAKEVKSDHEVQRQKQYLVKYKGLAHVHNRWIAESQMLLEHPVLLARYKKYQCTRWKIEWTLPQRLLQKRLLCFCDDYLHEHHGEDSDCHYEWLVKWNGLGYDHATWELDNAGFMKSSKALKLMEDFEIRHKNEKRCFSKEDKGEEIIFSELSELKYGGLPRMQNEYVHHIGKLCECWQRRKNAVVFDDQERVVKMILFILTLRDNTLPFLIITTSSSLSVWEAEFSKCTSSINTVVYKGSKDVRAIIRALEFYNEEGCVMLQVMLSPPDVVAEDLRILEGIKWGVIVVDECQRPRISVHLKQLKALTADAKLLLVNGKIKDRRLEYLNLLSFLDSGFDGLIENASEDDPIYDISELKERLACLVAFECKLPTSKFIEYWVPVRLSNVQLEQYCSALLSNSMLLCSSLRNGSVDSLREILIWTRKCCDHPYLLDTDHSLRGSVTRDCPVGEHLDADIEVSGKLQLLDKLLLQIKELGFRVLILFQSISGSGISIGDILDDFVHQRFGKDSYVRIDGGEIVRSKKQAALDLFNHKKSDKFVFLIGSRACLRSIKLSCVDTIILFDSDWDPLNDIRALEKITIDSQFEQLKVFRLYSSYTVEEKVLILAKQGLTLDSNIRNVSRSTCHMMLAWGALHLFNKLDDFHGYDALVSHSIITSEESYMSDVVSEFSALLPHNGENRNHNNSIILEVQMTEQAYPQNISLPGEVEAQSTDNVSLIQRLLQNESPPVFWSNLLEGRHPRWKFLSGSSPQLKRRTQRSDDLSKETELIENIGTRKWRTEVSNSSELICSKPKMNKKRKLDAGGKDSKQAAGAHTSSRKSKSLQYSTDKMDDPNGPSDSMVPPVAHDISRESDGTNGSTSKQGIVTEVKQRYRAVTSINGEAPTSELIVTSLPTMQPQVFQDHGSKEYPHQLPVSTDLPSTECGVVSVLASIDVLNHQSNRSHASDQQAQVPIHPTREDSTGAYNSSVSQLTTAVSLQPSIRLTVGAIAPAVLDGHNHYACSDSLQMEMERTQKDKEQAIKIHEDMKLQLKAECEKEIDETRKKYDKLLQRVETALLQKEKDLEIYYNKVYANKLLAEALTHKYENVKAAGSKVNVPALMNLISHLYLQHAAATLSLEQSSANLPMAGPPVPHTVQVVNHYSPAVITLDPEQSNSTLPITGSPEIPLVQMVDHSSTFQQTAARMTMEPEQSLGTVPMTGLAVPPPMQTVTCASASQRTSGGTMMGHEQPASALWDPFRPSPHWPSSNPVIHYRGNVGSGCEFRSPAPHLQHSRPSPELSPLYHPILSNGMPNLQAPTESSVTSSGPTQATELLTFRHWGISQPGNNAGSPSNQCSPSGGKLPINIIKLPASDLLSEFSALLKLESA